MSPLNNRINFNIVNWLQHVLMYIVQKLLILKLESDPDPEPKKLSEHGPALRLYIVTFLVKPPAFRLYIVTFLVKPPAFRLYFVAFPSKTTKLRLCLVTFPSLSPPLLYLVTFPGKPQYVYFT